MDRIAIIGAGDLGRQIAYYARRNGLEVVGFYDDYYGRALIEGCPVLGPVSQIEEDYRFGNARWSALVCGIGYKHFAERARLFEYFFAEKGIPFATIIDKSCLVDPTAIIGAGCVLFPASIVDKGVVLGNNVLMNVGATIAHDSRVKSHSFLSPRVAIAGFSEIGERCMCGINSTVIDNIIVGDDIRLGAGTVVIDSLDEAGLYVGVPAKLKKR